MPRRGGGAPADLSRLEALTGASGVAGHSGPYAVTVGTLAARGLSVPVQVIGRDAEPASIDQPQVTSGTWLREVGLVLERAFAQALGVGPGDAVAVDGHSFRVAGVAVTAALTPYPEMSCLATCFYGEVPANPPGLLWLTRADLLGLSPDRDALSYVLSLRLRDPDNAPSFVAAHSGEGERAPFLTPWQKIRADTAGLVENERRVLLTAGWLLGFFAVASVSVLVGGRMADQIRRVGLLKAVGGAPGLIACVLLGSPGAPSITPAAVGLVVAVSVAVAVVATIVPAVRAARTSTVRALADAARGPRRTAWLIALSADGPAEPAAPGGLGDAHGPGRGQRNRHNLGNGARRSGLTMIPARLGARHTVAEILQSERG